MLKRLREPAMVLSAIGALITAAVAFGLLPEARGEAAQNALKAVAVLLFPAVGLGVREVVTPVTKAVEVATTAAAQAATQVVTEVSTMTAGVAGDVTDAGKDIVRAATQDVVRDTVGPALQTTVTTVGGVLDKVLPG